MNKGIIIIQARIRLIRNFLSFCLAIVSSTSILAQEHEKPNIIIIMADDMGYSDVGSFGGEIKTPNLDQLANNGVRFSQFYNAGRCCPSRAALLTGLYPHTTGMGWMTGIDMREPGYRGDLNDKCMTIAEVLKPAGYATYATGKWHVSENVKYYGPKHNWPLQRGFDKFYGIIPGAADFFNPVGLTHGNDSIYADEDFYLTDAISDTVVNYIEQHTAQEPHSPFFMYVSYNAPHWPLHAKEEDIKKYIELYEKGWDKLREERYFRLRNEGLIGESSRMTKRDEKIPAWEDIPESERNLWVKRMAVYAAQIDRMDQGIGRIVKALRERDIFDDTIIIFISDNGASAERISREDKTLEKLGTTDSYESYRINWANLSNTPFKRYKSSMHEGGVISPCIISWPKGISKKRIINTPGHVIDLMPTFLEVSGANYPSNYKGQTIAPLPGESLLSLLEGQDIVERPLFWEHEGHRALRLGKWKLVSRGNEKHPYTEPWELYNMETDRTETTDLAETYPERVNEMAGMWNDWAQENMVFPLNGTNIPTRFKTFGRKKTGYH